MLLNPPKHDLKTPASQTERVCVSVGSEAHTQNVTAVLALTISAGVRLTCSQFSCSFSEFIRSHFFSPSMRNKVNLNLA